MSAENRLGRLQGDLEIKPTADNTRVGNFPCKDFTTPEYAAFAERSRARWDLFTYIKVLLKQRRERRLGK